MAKFGMIGSCAQCRNKAEVKVYPNDNPQAICEDCYKGNQKLEGMIASKGGDADVPTPIKKQIIHVESTDEREHYIRTICNKATDEWLKSFISEVVTKKVLIYDWKTIIRNERWFSILDLRRFALEVDPDLDAPKIVPGGFQIHTDKVQPKKRGRKPKATNRKEEPINAT